METSSADTPITKGLTGIPRLVAALKNSLVGLRYAAAHEAAVRQELVAIIVGVPIAILLPVRTLEHLILVLSLLLVLLVEILNTAIENTVDRIGLEHHELAGRAKDLGSTAVLIALLMTGLCWAVIAGPVVMRWIG